MAIITGHTYYLGPPLPSPVWPAPTTLNQDGSISRLFRDALVKGSEAFSVVLRVPPYRELTCNFARCGQAAGIAHWFRDGISEAVTAYLPGVDLDDEDLVEEALALKPYPISLHIWHKLFKAERPVYGQFILTKEGATDSLMATAADALAFSFFSILGTT